MREMRGSAGFRVRGVVIGFRLAPTGNDCAHPPPHIWQARKNAAGGRACSSTPASSESMSRDCMPLRRAIRGAATSRPVRWNSETTTPPGHRKRLTCRYGVAWGRVEDRGSGALASPPAPPAPLLRRGTGDSAPPLDRGAASALLFAHLPCANPSVAPKAPRLLQHDRFLAEAAAARLRRGREQRWRRGASLGGRSSAPWPRSGGANGASRGI